jgi:hypothetical protein
LQIGHARDVGIGAHHSAHDRDRLLQERGRFLRRSPGAHCFPYEIAGTVELARRVCGVRRGAHDPLPGLDCLLTRGDSGLARIEDPLPDTDNLLGGIAHRVEAEERHDGDTGGDEEDEETTHCLRRYVPIRHTGNSPRAFPGTSYDRHVEIVSGPWGRSQIDSFLDITVIPIRIASAGRTSPLVQSLWFLYDDDAIWCASQAESVLTRRLRADPRCGFEVAGDLPPYRGVRGTGRVELLPEMAPAILPRLINRYLGDESSPLATWLMSRIDSEVAIRISGLRVTSYDFTSRMA